MVFQSFSSSKRIRYFQKEKPAKSDAEFTIYLVFDFQAA